MEKKTFEEINEIYDLEIEKVTSNIKKNKSKKVLLQFPEGIKPYSTVICDEVSGRLLEKDGDKRRLDCECFTKFF